MALKNINGTSSCWWRLIMLAAALAALAAVLTVVGLSYHGTLSGQTTTSGEQPLSESVAERSPSGSETDSELEEGQFARLRNEMVEQQIARRGIKDERVLDAMRRVPRHRFVPEPLRRQAYADHPLPIGHRQTISQPLIVAEMTELSRPKPGAKALDVGTGSGYQAAVLAELVGSVYSIEILQPLADEARQRLKTLGYDNIEVRCGDGYRGWPEQEPFDLIIVAAAPDHVPQPLVEQLAPGGRLVIPVGGRFAQQLLLIEKRADGTVERQNVVPVSFVPMTGEAENKVDR